MISVCLATYNGEKYLQKQLDSIIPQLRPGDELLVSDDGSSDATLKILEQVKTESMRVYKNQFRSPVRNFEFLFKTATQPLVVPCDQDDIWLPNKLDVVRQHLEGKDHSCILMNALVVDENDRETGGTTFERWNTRNGFWSNLWRNTFMGSSMAFTADLLQTALPFPKNIAMHDWWLGLLAEKTGTVMLVDQPTMKYRIHGKNTSLQGSSTLQKLKWRLQMYQAINQRLG